MVAMRLINSIERDSILAEYERWLWEEEVKCNQMDGILKQANRTESELGEAVNVVREFGEYCQSCRDERERVDQLYGVTDSWEKG